MNGKLKQRFRKTGLFITASAALGLLMIPAVRAIEIFPKGPAVLLIIYALANIAFLIWSCIQIIWKFPLKGSWRIATLIFWWIFYPVLCVTYISVCGFLALYVFNVR